MKFNLLLRIGMILAAVFSFTQAQATYGHTKNAEYEITVQNITKGQPFSPALIAIHSRSMKLFSLGEPASDALAKQAEDGDISELQKMLEASPQVLAVASGSGIIAPTAGETITISAKKVHGAVLTVTGMLVRTNDGFYALNSLPLPRRKGAAYKTTAMVYDAGSEVNTESCDHIPAPPCNNPGQRVTEGAEGIVTQHPGLQNVGDLSGLDYAFAAKAALITVKRVK